MEKFGGGVISISRNMQTGEWNALLEIARKTAHGIAVKNPRGWYNGGIMKSAVLAIFAAVFLAACGGGGGGDASVEPPPENRERAELRQEVANIETLIQDAGFSKPAAENLLAEVRNLQDAIGSLQNTIDVLRKQIRKLQERLEEEQDRLAQTPCGAGMERVNGACECAAATPRRVGDECLPPLSAADCNGEDKILFEGACFSCIGLTPRRVGNKCMAAEPPPPVCDGRITTPAGECVRSKEYKRSYGLSQINAAYAYHKGYFGQGVTVAVVELGRPPTEGGVQVTHPELAGNAVTGNIAGIDGRRFRDSGRNSHGTVVAAIIAAARNGTGAHGVAPSAKFIPFALADNQGVRENYIVDNNIPITNRSYRNQAPSGPPHILDDLDLIKRVADTFRNLVANDADVVHVFAAGNEGWNGGGRDFGAVSPSEDNLAPVAYPQLEDNWLSAVALNRNGSIASYSNGCGPAKRWCVAAPGHTAFTNDRGTSFAAPHVSGALAVLKSAAPNLPVTVVRAVLLTTAKDLGSRGVDDIYGWGRVDLEAGVKHLENLQTPQTAGLPARKLSALQISLPAEFSHLRERFKNATIAVQITEGAYYNMPLSDILAPNPRQKTPLNNAAEDMMDFGAAPPKPGFFAFGDSKNKFGLRYNGAIQNADMWAEISHAAGQDGLLGANFGAWGAAASKTTGAKIGVRRPLVSGLSVFGEYGYGGVRAKTGGYISAVRGAKTEEWTAGISYADIVRKGDMFRFSLRRAEAVSGGEMVLRLPSADGDFYESFFGENPQELSVRETRIPLKRNAPFIWTAGYAMKTGGGEWASAAEYNAETGEKKLTAKWRIRF